LHLLELTGCIVTIDAIGCQTKIAEALVQRGGDYLLAVKENLAGCRRGSIAPRGRRRQAAMLRGLSDRLLGQ